MQIKKLCGIAALALCSILLPAPHVSAKLTVPPPEGLTESTDTSPLSLSPLLSWSKNINAVAYEIEIIDGFPKKLSEKRPYKKAIFRSKDVFFNYYNPPIADCLKLKDGEVHPLLWRIRALDQNKKPVSPFSKPAIIFVNKSVAPMNEPIPLSPLEDNNTVQLLYPVYSWAIQSASSTYEVELYDTPDIEKTTPIWKSTSTYHECYDDSPRIKNTPYYWRVRSFDSKGNQLGSWSKLVSFSNVPHKVRVAVLGDSITHGGGHISFGPNDSEFNWLTYLDFPAVNLAESGNLTRDMAKRFDADVLPFAPKYLLIMAGTNDIRSKSVPISETIKNLEIIRDKCLKNNIRPIFLTLPPINPTNIKKAFNEIACNDWKDKLNQCNKFIRSMPYYIDTAAYFAPICKKDILPTGYALDGLHPDANGKALIAKSVNENWLRVSQ